MDLTTLVKLWTKENPFQGPLSKAHKNLWDLRNQYNLIAFRFCTRARGRAFVKWAREQGYTGKIYLEKVAIIRKA